MPRRFRSFLLLVFLAVFILVSRAHSAPQSPPSPPVRDPQAVALLAQALGVAGGTAAFGQVKDFTATGNITYSWAGQQVNGAVTLRGRGTDQFRLDANLPEGTRSWAVNNGQGSIKDFSGRTTAIPFSGATNLGSLTFPYLGMAAALSDTSMSLSISSQLVGEKQVYDVRIQKNFAFKEDPTGEFSRVSVKHYIIDAVTFALVETQDIAFPSEAPRTGFQHEIIFSDYRQSNGMLVPFSITEKIAEQETWTVQLQSITFNAGLTSGTFQL